MKIKLICKQCKREFYVYPSRKDRKFCSRKCYDKWQSENLRGEKSPSWKGKIKLICQQCGKEYYVYSQRKDTSHFCSFKCKGEWMVENLKGENNTNYRGGNIISICLECGKEYYITPSIKDTSHFCSYECRSKWMTENKSGENSPLYKGYIVLTCEQCGEEYYVHPYREEQSRFCSKKCKGKYQQQDLEFAKRISVTYQGISYNEWEDFAINSPYCSKFNDKFKEQIRNLYNRKCFLCGKTEEDNGRKLDVHHVNYNKNCLCGLVCEFVPLCQCCHGKTQTKRKYWEDLIMCYLHPNRYFIIDL